MSLAIVASRFNEHVTDNLLQGCLLALRELGLSEESWRVYHVPGAYELPVVAQALATQKKYQAIICLGAVIQGETPHFIYICEAVSAGLMDVSLKHGIPVIFGVLTTATLAQAEERSGSPIGNKGYDAAQSALEMIHVMKTIAEPKATEEIS